MTLRRPDDGRGKPPDDQSGPLEGIRAVLFRKNYHHCLDRRERLGPRPRGKDRVERLPEEVKALGNERWFCYVIECADGTFYTGITNSIDRRRAVHKPGRASRYTPGPLSVRFGFAAPY